MLWLVTMFSIKGLLSSRVTDGIYGILTLLNKLNTKFLLK